jgi:hypothetical protein
MKFEFEDLDDFAYQVKNNAELNEHRTPPVAMKLNIQKSRENIEKDGKIIEVEVFYAIISLTAVGFDRFKKEEPYSYEDLVGPCETYGKAQEMAQAKVDELKLRLNDKASNSRILNGRITTMEGQHGT